MAQETVVNTLLENGTYVPRNASRSFINKLYVQIYSDETPTQDEVQEAMAEYYPHYNACDETLDTDFDTCFKDAHSDHGVTRLQQVVPQREKVVIKDYPFSWECMGHTCAGVSGGVELITQAP